MKKILILAMFCLISSVVWAERQLPRLGNYQDVRIVRVSARGIRIMHKSGSTWLKEEELSPHSRELLKEELKKVKELQEIAVKKREIAEQREAKEEAAKAAVEKKRIAQDSALVKGALEKAARVAVVSEALKILIPAKKYAKAAQYPQLLKEIERLQKIIQEKSSREIIPLSVDILRLYLENKHDEAIKKVLPLAQKGSPEAQFLAGGLFFEKARFILRKVVIDTYNEQHSNKQIVRIIRLNRKEYNAALRRAVFWYQKSAENNNFNAAANLGYMYVRGIGVSRNQEKGREMIQAAAAQNVAIAEHYMGELFLYGIGVQKSISKANNYFNKAAEKGLAEAYLGLALAFERSAGTGNCKSPWSNVVMLDRRDNVVYLKGRDAPTGNIMYRGKVSREKASQNREKLRGYLKQAENSRNQFVIWLLEKSNHLPEAVKKQLPQKIENNDPRVFFLLAKYSNSINECQTYLTKAAQSGHELAEKICRYKISNNM